MTKYSVLCLAVADLSACNGSNSQSSQTGSDSSRSDSTEKLNIVIMLTDDQGYGDMNCYGNHGGSTGGLREGKGTTFEGGQRVPLIARMSGHIPAGKVSDQFFSALDITPTLVEMTGS